MGAPDPYTAFRKGPPDAVAVSEIIGRAIRKALREPVLIANPDGLTDEQGQPITQIELPDYIVAAALRVECGHKVFHQLLVALAANLPAGAEPWAKPVAYSGVAVYPCHWLADDKWQIVNPFKLPLSALVDPRATPAAIVGLLGTDGAA